MAKAKTLHILTADEIFAAKDIEERTVEVPQWGGAVRIRTFTKKQIQDIQKRCTRTNPITKQTETDDDLIEALTFIEGVIEPKFTVEDYERLSKEKSAAGMVTVIKAITDASGLSQKAIDEAAKSAASESNGQV